MKGNNFVPMKRDEAQARFGSNTPVRYPPRLRPHLVPNTIASTARQNLVVAIRSEGSNAADGPLDFVSSDKEPQCFSFRPQGFVTAPVGGI